MRALEAMAALCVSILVGCASSPPRMRYGQLSSAAMHKPMAYGLYTPPGWSPEEHLPVFLFLHGGADDVRCLEAQGVAAYLDQELVAGRLPRVAVVVPQGDRGFWANWADGSRRYEDWALAEALPWAARELGVPDCAAGCHLLGISMGGNGALRMMLSHPGAFRSVGIVSGPTLDSGGMTELANSWLYRTFARVDRIFGPPDDEARKRRADPFVRWRSPEDLAGTRLFVAHGDDDRDGIERTNRALHLHLEERGIAHRYVVYRGGHRWNDWKPVMAQAIRYGLGAD